MKSFICVILLGLLAHSALSGVTSASFTSASFANSVAPDTVFTSSNATDSLWALSTGTAGYTSSSVYMASPYYIVYGAGLTNDTIYAWGVVASGQSTGTFSGVMKRTINATTVAAGSDSAENAVNKTPGDMASVSGTGVSFLGKLGLAAGGGYLAVAMVTAGTNNDNLIVYVYSGSASSLSATTVTILSQTAGTSGTPNLIAIATNCLWYEDGNFYILYETQSGTATVTGLYLQRFSTSGTLTYTTPVNMLPTTTYVGTANVAATMSLGGQSNYTGSTYTLVSFKDPVALKVYSCSITPKTGATSSSCTALATDVTYVSTTTDGYTYYPAGLIMSNGTYGVAVAYGKEANAGTTIAYNVSVYLNGSSTTNTSVSATLSGLITSTTTASTVSPILVSGFNYQAGYGLLFKYISATGTPSTYTYVYQLYMANSTMIGSQVTLGTLSTVAPVSVFTDAYGGLWLGYTTTDSAGAYAAIGSVGKVVAQTNYTSSSTTSGVMTSFVASLFLFVIVSLFMI